MAETAGLGFVDLMALGAMGQDGDKYMSKRPSFNPGRIFSPRALDFMLLKVVLQCCLAFFDGTHESLVLRLRPRY